MGIHCVRLLSFKASLEWLTLHTSGCPANQAHAVASARIACAGTVRLDQEVSTTGDHDVLCCAVKIALQSYRCILGQMSGPATIGCMDSNPLFWFSFAFAV